MDTAYYAKAIKIVIELKKQCYKTFVNLDKFNFSNYWRFSIPDVI